MENNLNYLISISDGIRRHKQSSCQKGYCGGRLSFDGAGGFFGNNNDVCREIHLDLSKNWDTSFSKVSGVLNGKSSLLWVLAHDMFCV